MSFHQQFLYGKASFLTSKLGTIVATLTFRQFFKQQTVKGFHMEATQPNLKINQQFPFPEEPNAKATTIEKAIFELECGEIFYDQNNFELSLEHAQKALAQKKLDLSTKLQISDLVGRCHRQLGSDRDVYLSLQRFIKYLNRFPSEGFAFSIYSNYLQSLVELGFEKEAREEFENRPKYFKKIKNDLIWIERYAMIRKLKYLFFKKYESNDQAWKTLESLIEIGEFLNDSHLSDFASKELEAYKYDDDESQVFYFTDWVYLRFDEIALFKKDQRISHLGKNDNIKKIIELLSTGSQPVDEFFKAIVNKTYDHDAHEKFLEQILTKVNRALGDYCICNEQSRVFLK